MHGSSSSSEKSQEAVKEPPTQPSPMVVSELPQQKPCFGDFAKLKGGTSQETGLGPRSGARGGWFVCLGLAVTAGHEEEKTASISQTSDLDISAIKEPLLPHSIAYKTLKPGSGK
jgi:hypothetical protein